MSTAQSPEGINYQAALRDSETGEALADQMVFIIITIRTDGPAGEIVYAESHPSIQTNDYGLINLVIGGGDGVDGNFSDIPWSSGNIWYEIEVDSGSGLESLGASQFLSVPYALFAGNAEASLDNDPTNELIDSAEFDPESQTITIEESGNTVNVSLEGLSVEDADSNPTNELIVSASFDVESNSIVLSQGDGSELVISLAELDNSDADSDPTNELITSANYNPEANVINLQQADGSIVMISLSELPIADADADPENELIDPESGLQLQGLTLTITEAGTTYSTNLDIFKIDDIGFTLINDTILTLTEGGTEYSINLASLRDDGDWIFDEDQNHVVNENQEIGVGTSSPQARLDVVEEESSQAALRVQSGDKTVLEGINERIGIGTAAGVSTIQMGGSVGHDVTVINSLDSDSYTAGSEDHIIVINFQSGGNDQFGIFLPPADVCEGRIYVIRKTGVLGAIGDITIDSGTFPIDFDQPNLLLDENTAETAVMLSLGNDGWTRILREN